MDFPHLGAGGLESTECIMCMTSDAKSLSLRLLLEEPHEHGVAHGQKDTREGLKHNNS